MRELRDVTLIWTGKPSSRKSSAVYGTVLQRFWERLSEINQVLASPENLLYDRGGAGGQHPRHAQGIFDIDLVVKLDGQGFPSMFQMLKRLGFNLLREDAEQILRMDNRMITMSTVYPYRIDLWLIRTAYDQVAFDRRR